VSENAIEVRGLVKRYGDLTAVDGLDLIMRRGECFGLLGPNGAGKTTTVEILEGLNDPTAGDVQVLGRRWAADESWLRARLGISLQETHLQERLTVLETLRLFRSFYPRGRDVGELMKLVALEEKRDTWFSKLSGGQKQRLAVACALVGDPEVLFLDEPTASLDPAATKAIEDVIRAVAAQCKVVMATHDLGGARRLAGEIVLVHRGRVLENTPAAEFFECPKSEEARRFIAGDLLV
jgi:ABC-2 type transport system ATP-binding protein